MATSDIMTSQLRLTFVTGTDQITGDPLFASKSFNNVKPTSQASQLLTVAEALAQLQTHSLFKIERNDSSEITAS